MPEFDGLHDPEAFLDWIEAIERISEYKRYDERKRFKFAVHSLTEKASYWYERLKAKRRMEGKQKIQSWEKLKKHLKRKFLPRDYEQELYFQRIKSQIVHRKQEERKRLILDSRTPTKPTPTQKIDLYMTTIEREVQRMRKIKKAQQEAAMKAQKQQDELVRASNSISTVPMSKEVKHEPIVQQQTSIEVTLVYNNPLYEEDNAQETHTPAATSLASEEETPTHAATSLVSEEKVQEDQEPATSMEEEEDEANSRPSMEESTVQEVQNQSALSMFKKPQRQQAQPNLRANSFQEREIDAGARGPKQKPNEVSRESKPMEDLRRETEPMIKNDYTSNSKLDELKYQNPP